MFLLLRKQNAIDIKEIINQEDFVVKSLLQIASKISKKINVHVKSKFEYLIKMIIFFFLFIKVA